MIRKLHPRPSALALASLLLLATAGCPWDLTRNDETSEARLVPFSSAEELLSYLKEQARARTDGGSFGGLFRFGLPLGAAAPGELADADGNTAGTADGDAQGLSFSTTNIQEAGVDESDVVKSDGTYFYIACGDTLRIVKATPTSEMSEVGRLDLDVHVSEMYLYGSKLILLAQRYEAYGGGWGMPEVEIWPPFFVGSDLTLVEVDVSQPAEPAVTKEVELDGSLVDSRLTNGRLILVLTIAPELSEDPTPVTINLMALDEFMPKIRGPAGEREMVAWQDCLHPASPDGYYMTAVMTLDADDIETVVHSVALVAGAGTIYASPEALYVTDAEYDPEDDYREMTAIHKFGFDDDGAAQYVASGSVPGRLLNQFSLGEYEDYLRVATHVTNYSQIVEFFGDDEVAFAVNTAQRVTLPEEFNAVYVLGQTDSELEVTGAIENIAPDEQLHSARFMGERGFLVTFRRIDPLFVLDLSDPTDPQVRGELKIPGYSDYLHPLGDDHLIGVGRSVVTMSSWGGEEPAAAQLSLFDVSDPNNPTLVQQLELGGMHSWSYVTQTHKAFTLMPEQGLLAIPMRLSDVGTSYREYDLDAFYGVVCFEVDTETGFTELGRIEAVESPEDYYEAWYPGSGFWMRAAFIGETLYAISADGVAAAPLNDLEDVTTLELEE